MRTYKFIMVIFLFILLWKPILIFGTISVRERDSLEALYNKTNGRDWLHQENWKNAPGTESSWHGITCDAGNTTVLEIRLPGNGLQGVLPLDMDAFSSLITLDLSHNRLTGEIPRWIEKFKNLKKLDLSNNNFKGPIPSWVGNLKNLEELFLDNNRLEGTIPDELGNLVNLRVLRIASNRFIGEIPATLSKLVNLEDNRSNFKWNGLYTQDISIKDFLQKKQIDGDWQIFQTTAPSGIDGSSTENTISIKWLPILYFADSGGYRVFYREEGHPYDNKFVEAVTDKTTTKVFLKELKKCTKYYFKICTWTDSHDDNKNKIESPLSNEISITTKGIIISGAIKKKDGEGVPGVLITASNGGGTAETKKDGVYKLNVIPGWTGIVTPKKKGYIFSPPSINLEAGVTEEINGKDFTIESNTVISGTVTYHGKGISYVKLNFIGNDKKSKIALTDDDGNYRLEVPYNWAGTITPTKDRHRFNPRERKCEDVKSPRDEDFAVQLPKIFGYIRDFRGRGIGEVKLNFSNIDVDNFCYLTDYAITGENGYYENNTLEEWKGLVKPVPSIKSRYFFDPPYIEAEYQDSADKELNFRAWLKFKFSITTSGYVSFTDFRINSEITIEYKLNHKFRIWSGIELNNLYLLESLLKKSFSSGISYFIPVENPSKDIWRVSIGIARFKYKELSTNSEVSKKIWGVFIKQSLLFNINDRWFVEWGTKLLIVKTNFLDLYVAMGLGLGYRF